MVITGDLKQSDRYAENGLLDLLKKLERFRESALSRAIDLAGFNTTIDELSVDTFPKGIRAVEMTMADVERSAIVRQVLSLYEPPRTESFPSPNSLKKQEFLKEETPPRRHTPEPAPCNTTSFELVDRFDSDGNDDAALMPKQHVSRRTLWKL